MNRSWNLEEWVATPGEGTATRRRSLLFVAVAALLSGCTLISSSTRPTPDAARNLFCLLEYRPDPGRLGEPDVLFLAAAMPYKVERAYMSLPDALLHGILAPGRHLVAPVHLRGLRCEPPLWEAGHRLPGYLKTRHHLLCRREGLERVEIEVRTKWGSCRREIPGGDPEPRCHDWASRRDAPGLARLSATACPSLPLPTRESRRGSTSCGAPWVVLREGTGAIARSGDVVHVHETVVTRGSAVATSTHFRGEPRRLVLGGGEWPVPVDEAVIGMRVGERRRLFVPVPRPPGRPVTPDSPAGQPSPHDLLLYHDLELLAVE